MIIISHLNISTIAFTIICNETPSIQGNADHPPANNHLPANISESLLISSEYGEINSIIKCTIKKVMLFPLKWAIKSLCCTQFQMFWNFTNFVILQILQILLISLNHWGMLCRVLKCTYTPNLKSISQSSTEL